METRYAASRKRMVPLEDEQDGGSDTVLHADSNGKSPRYISTKDTMATVLTTTRKREYVWRNVILMLTLHIASVYSLYIVLMGRVMVYTVIWGWLLHTLSCLGITAGAHRLWCHRSYKAKFPLRLFLAVLQTMAFQNDIYEWSRDHRTHHKFSETDGDPHNAKRGFFFSHVGWLLVRKNPEVIAKGKTIDTADLLKDPIVIYQRKHYKLLVLIFCFLAPTLVPHLLWQETLMNAYLVGGLLKYCTSLNMTWCVNSAAHMWGNRPYDRHIDPAENMLVTFGALGEGFHNFHHTFPQDYGASELPNFNVTTRFLDVMASLGQVINRRHVSPNIVASRKGRTGDGSKVL